MSLKDRKNFNLCSALSPVDYKTRSGLRPITPYPFTFLHSCPPFPLKPKPLLLFRTLPKATFRCQAQARTPLIHPIPVAMSPSTESKTSPATRHPSSKVKKNNGQRSRRTLPQRCIHRSYQSRIKSLNPSSPGLHPPGARRSRGPMVLLSPRHR